MGFYKTKNIYKVTRITGSQNNILGVSFSEKYIKECDLEIIEWDFPANAHEKIITSKELVIKQVMTGLDSVNEALNTNYKLSRIYFSPFDSDSNSVYSLLICKLIRHYHDGKKFIEV